MRKNQKLASHTRKVCCILLTPCMLLSSCQKSAEDSPQGLIQNDENLIAAPQPTQSPIPTPTTIPEPTPTITSPPTSTPAPTPPPKPTTSWIFPFSGSGTENLADIFSDETQNTVDSLTYNPYGEPELFARYHGHINSKEYIIDIIKMQPNPRINQKNLIRLQFYDSSSWFEDPKMTQELCVYFDFYELRGMENFIDTFDINNDGHTDFSLNLGVDVKNKYYLYFVYDESMDGYAYLGTFSYPTFLHDEQVLYETEYFTNYYVATKYKIDGIKAIATESASESYDTSYLYTYKKWMDDEPITIIETDSFDKFKEIVDISKWPYMDWATD